MCIIAICVVKYKLFNNNRETHKNELGMVGGGLCSVSIVRHLFANFLKEANNNEDEHVRSMNADCNFT